MKIDLSVRRLAMTWILIGAWVTIGGLSGLALAVLIDQGTLNVVPAKLPAPLNLVGGNLLAFSVAQILLGASLCIAGMGLFRGNSAGRIVLQALTVGLIGWFVFLGGFTLWSSMGIRQPGTATPLVFPVLPAVGFCVAILGFSLWALGRPSISGELLKKNGQQDA